MSYTFERCRHTKDELTATSTLLLKVFPKASFYSEVYLEWQYYTNPVGNILGFNAFSNGELVAHYAAIPMRAKVYGKEAKGLLSLNTVTHPDHHRKGLFSKLVKMTYAAAREEGFEFAYGIANKNSTLPFIKSGFSHICALDSAIGVGRPFRYVKEPSCNFAKIWDQDSVSWRFGNPLRKYIASSGDKVKSIYGELVKGIFRPFMGQLSDESMEHTKLGRHQLPSMNVWLGLIPKSMASSGAYFSIPLGLRPSPLNLIYLPLADSEKAPKKGEIFFQTMDFDAF